MILYCTVLISVGLISRNVYNKFMHIFSCSWFIQSFLWIFSSYENMCWALGTMSVSFHSSCGRRTWNLLYYWSVNKNTFLVQVNFLLSSLVSLQIRREGPFTAFLSMFLPWPSKRLSMFSINLEGTVQFKPFKPRNFGY